MISSQLLFYLVSIAACSAQQMTAAPVTIQVKVINGTSNGVCPDDSILNEQRRQITAEVSSILQQRGPTGDCMCDGSGARVA